MSHNSWVGKHEKELQGGGLAAALVAAPWLLPEIVPGLLGGGAATGATAATAAPEAAAGLAGGLGSGAAGEVSGGLAMAGNPANPLSIGASNFMTANPWIDKGLTAFGNAGKAMGGANAISGMFEPPRAPPMMGPNAMQTPKPSPPMQLLPQSGAPPQVAGAMGPGSAGAGIPPQLANNPQLMALLMQMMKQNGMA